MILKNVRRRLRHRKIALAEQIVLVDVTADGQPLSGQELETAIRQVVGPNVYIYHSDRDYLALDRWVLESFLQHDLTNRYTAEGGVCDAFSYDLKGNVSRAMMRVDATTPVAFGLVGGRFKLGDAKKLTEMHMMCCALLNDGELVLIEPQNDKIYPFTDESKVVMVLV